MAKKPVIAIIGGYGGMGRLFASVFSGKGYSVVISGPSEAAGKKTASELGAEYVKDNKKAAGKADVVIVSVPISATEEVIAEVAPAVKAGSLLMDLTSVKTGPCNAMEEYAGKDVEVVGTHPLFGHRVGTLEGQVVVLTPVRGKKRLAWLKEFLEEHKVRVHETTPEKHDEVMAVVQGLTHFTYISIASTLKRLDYDMKASRKFSSPVYDLMLDMVGRIIGQNPELYASIQMQNPHVPVVHKFFLESAEELSSAVAGKDRETFVRIMSDAARHFDDLERSMGRSDKAIYSLIAELDLLKKSVGKEVCLMHIYSRAMHIGIVRRVSAEEVVLEEKGRRHALKLSNLKVLSDEERRFHRKAFYGTVQRDYSVVYDAGVDEDFVLKLLCENNEDIASACVKDVYSGDKIGEGKKSVCFGLEFVKRDLKAEDREARHFFKSLGGRMR